MEALCTEPGRSLVRPPEGGRPKTEAETFLAALPQRFAQFGLELHPDKTRLIKFGPSAEKNRRDRGEGKPETFDFLGFTAHLRTKTVQWILHRPAPEPTHAVAG